MKLSLIALALTCLSLSSQANTVSQEMSSEVAIASASGETTYAEMKATYLARANKFITMMNSDASDSAKVRASSIAIQQAKASIDKQLKNSPFTHTIMMGYANSVQTLVNNGHFTAAAKTVGMAASLFE